MIRKILAVIFLLALWQICATVMSLNVLPYPEAVAAHFIRDFRNISIHTVYSLYRLFAGIVLAVLVGAPVGMALGYSAKLDGLAAPLVYILAPVPKIAFLPLIMVFLGVGDRPKIFIVFIVMLFQVIIVLRDTVKEIPEELYLTLLAAKSKTSFIIRHIVIPASAPGIFTSVRLGLSTGIAVLFIAETFGTVHGIGFYIMDRWLRIDYTAMYAGIITMGVVGFTLTAVTDFLQAKLCPWSNK